MPRSRRITAIFTVFLILLLCVLLAVLALRLGMQNSPPTSVVVTYRVNSTHGTSHVQYTMSNGKDSEFTQVQTPWEKRVVFTEWMDIYLIAGNDVESGKVSCEILVNGVSKDKQEAEYPKGDKVGCRVILP